MTRASTLSMGSGIGQRHQEIRTFPRGGCTCFTHLGLLLTAQLEVLAALDSQLLAVLALGTFHT